MRELLNQISEKEFQLQVIQLAKMFGWRIHAERPAWTGKGWRTPIQGDAGFPDLVLVREIHPEEVQRIFAELKSEEGKLTEDQKVWVRLLNAYVWRPSQIKEIAKILR